MSKILEDKIKVKKLENILAIIFTAFITAMYFSLWSQGSGLWRDEVNTINVFYSSFNDLWNFHYFDSFPMLWLWIVKAWTTVTYTDFGLRTLGLITALSIIAAFWFTLRIITASSPVWALLLWGTIPLVLQASISLRAYGCGSVLTIISVIAFWNIVKNPSSKNILIAMLVSIATVQCLFQTATILLSLGIGALTVAIVERNIRVVIAVILCGAASILSVLPHFHYLFENEWNHIIRHYPDYPYIIERFLYTLRSSGQSIIIAWLIISFLVLFSVIKIYKHPQWRILLFLTVSLGCAVISYTIMLKEFASYLQAWHYLPFIALSVTLISAIITIIFQSYVKLYSALLASAVVLIAVSSQNLWLGAQTRWTNIDLITHALNPEVDSKDFILLNSAWEGITFKRYYQGQASWQSLPGFEGYTHLVHEGARMKQAMQEEEPLADIFAPIEETLRNGGRVWLVGNFQFLKEGTAFVKLPPAPHSPYGWYLPPYERYWSQATAAFVQHNAQQLHLARPPDTAVNPYENLPIFVAWGWRESVMSE
jgi:hypothetical protein